MSWEPIRINREELHRLVWSKSLRRVGEELGTSYLELVKACTTMEIPRPMSGEWKNFLLAKSVDQVPPLPEARTGVAVECFLRPIERFCEADLPPLPDESQALEVEVVQAETGRPRTDTILEPTRDRGPVTVTRPEVYDKVWQMPLKRLAQEWRMSYVQLVAACEVMNVPRPPNGYWARLSLGLPVEQIQLPEAGPGIPTEVTLQPQFSRGERAVKAAEMRQAEATEAELSAPPSGDSGENSGNTAGVEPQANVRPSGKRLEPGRVELPLEGVELHPIAERHMQALQNAKPGELGFVGIRGSDLFCCDMTSALVPRLARAVHALVYELEHRGYSFEEETDDGEGLGILRDGDRVEVRWSEGKIDSEREPTNVDKRRPSWTWNLKETKATGELAVEVNGSGLKGRRKWKEGDGRSLEETLGVVVEKVEATFRLFSEQRRREAELARQQEEAEKHRLEEAAREAERQAKLEKERKAHERVLRHEAKLEQIAELRRQNLLVAAKLWIQSRGVAAYVAYCEVTWRVTSGGTLTQAQADWLAWAKGEAGRMGPFGKGYPMPEKDGNLDISTIPVGGPYPEPTELERLGEVEPKPSAAEPEVRYVEVPRQPEQFPFWLLHRNH